MFKYQSNEHNKFAVQTLLENRNRMIDDSSGTE